MFLLVTNLVSSTKKMLLSLQPNHPHYYLIALYQRDDYYDNPYLNPINTDETESKPSSICLETNDVSYIGITKSGKFAAITFIQEIEDLKKAFSESTDIPRPNPAISKLVSEYLYNNEEISALEFLQNLAKRFNKMERPGFNLICGDLDSMYFYSNTNHERVIFELQRGDYAMDCTLMGLQSDYHKTKDMKKIFLKKMDELEDHLSKNGNIEDFIPSLIQILHNDKRIPFSEASKDSPLGQDVEWKLSSAFISSSLFGTRSSSVFIIQKNKPKAICLTQEYDVPSNLDKKVTPLDVSRMYYTHLQLSPPPKSPPLPEKEMLNNKTLIRGNEKLRNEKEKIISERDKFNDPEKFSHVDHKPRMSKIPTVVSKIRRPMSRNSSSSSVSRSSVSRSRPNTPPVSPNYRNEMRVPQRRPTRPPRSSPKRMLR